MKEEERRIKEENIKNVLIELSDIDIEDISSFISGRLKQKELTKKYSLAFEELKGKHRNYKEKSRMIKDYGVKIGKVNQKEYEGIMKYKGNRRRDFRLKSFKRKGNLRVIYLYV